MTDHEDISTKEPRRKVKRRPIKLRITTRAGLELPEGTRTNLSVRDLKDNRSFRLVNPLFVGPYMAASPLGKAPSVPRHVMEGHMEDYAGFFANIVVTSFHERGRFNDFLTGEFLHKGERSLVMLQIARPENNEFVVGRVDTVDRSVNCLEAECRFLNEAKNYWGAASLQGTFVPKFHGLWIGSLPCPISQFINKYERDKLLVLVTEYLPLSYNVMMERSLHLPSSAAETTPGPSPFPDTLPTAIWSQLPAGLRDCYAALLREDLHHHALQRKHWRGDTEGQWRVPDFTKAWWCQPPVSKQERERPTQVQKTVTFDAEVKLDPRPSAKTEVNEPVT